MYHLRLAPRYIFYHDFLKTLILRRVFVRLVHYYFKVARGRAFTLGFFLSSGHHLVLLFVLPRTFCVLCHLPLRHTLLLSLFHTRTTTNNYHRCSLFVVVRLFFVFWSIDNQLFRYSGLRFFFWLLFRRALLSSTVNADKMWFGNIAPWHLYARRLHFLLNDDLLGALRLSRCVFTRILLNRPIDGDYFRLATILTSSHCVILETLEGVVG